MNTNDVKPREFWRNRLSLMPMDLTFTSGGRRAVRRTFPEANQPEVEIWVAESSVKRIGRPVAPSEPEFRWACELDGDCSPFPPEGGTANFQAVEQNT
jgi:hypothetical protein